MSTRQFFRLVASGRPGRSCLSEPPALLRITPGVGVKEFDLTSDPNADPDVLAAGPDSQLWMPDLAGTDGGLTAVTTSGTFTNHRSIVPTPRRDQLDRQGPRWARDSLWLTDQTANTIDNVSLDAAAVTTTTTSTTSTTTTATTTTPGMTQTPPPVTPALPLRWSPLLP